LDGEGFLPPLSKIDRPSPTKGFLFNGVLPALDGEGFLPPPLPNVAPALVAAAAAADGFRAPSSPLQSLESMTMAVSLVSWGEDGRCGRSSSSDWDCWGSGVFFLPLFLLIPKPQTSRC
jgi:hypothetical protein